MDKSHINAITEKLKPESSKRHKVGFAIGMVVGIAIVLSFDAVLLLLLFKAFGVDVLFWPCLFLAFAIQYFVTKLK